MSTDTIRETDIVAGISPNEIRDLPDGSSALSIKAILFGQMVREGRKLHDNYLGDVYHDALWLNEHVALPGSFIWGFSGSHTNIGPDSGDAEHTIKTFNEVAYRIEIVVDDRNRWKARWTLLKGDNLV